MSRGKKGNSKRTTESSGGENIDTVTINDEQWKCCIVFVGAKCGKDIPYVQELASVVCAMKHKKLYGLDKEKLLQIAHSDAKLAGNSQSGGGGRRSKQTTTQPSGAKYMQVCESIASLENDIPATMMARLLKYVVLKRRLQDLVDVEDMIQQGNEDPASGKGGKKAQQSSARNSKAGKKGKNTPVSATETTAVPLPVKQETNMLKRGQDDDAKYLCNEQQNGPNCYIIVTGISADIIKESIAVKLPVNVLMKLEVNTDHDDGTYHENRTDGIAVEQLWMDIQQAVYNSPSGNMLRNLACVDLQVDLCSQFTTEHQNRSKLGCGHEILDEVVEKIYQVEKSLLHYHSYLSHLKLYEVSSVCDYRYPDTKRKRKGILSCDTISADVSDILQAMIDKVECSAHQQSEPEMQPLRLAMQEEAASLCDIKTSAAQKDSKCHIQLPCCPTSAHVKSTIAQSIYTRVLNEVQQHSTEKVQKEDEGVLISDSDLHLYLILLSLEHVCLSNASTPRNSKNDLTSQYICDHPLKVVGDTSTKPIDDFSKEISEYSSFELFSKSGIIQTLHVIQETHPYIELFHHASSNCMVLVAHSGYCGSRAHSYDVQARSHSNIGFYNFLKYVDEAQYENISEAEQQDTSFVDQLEDDSSSNLSAIPQFYGYNVGDTLLHLQSSFSTVFTSDGIQIHIEKQEFLENSATLSVSVLTTEGHKISCVKSDVGLDEIHQVSSRNDSQIYRSVDGLNHMLMMALLSNGLKVATCCSGSNRAHTTVNDNKDSISPQKIDIESPIQEKSATSNTEPSAFAEEETRSAKKASFQNEYHHLYATTSLGLNIHTYVALPSEVELKTGNILVKQEYYKVAEVPPEEVTEIYRYYLQEGLVVYIMNDDSFIIYCADGGIYRTATKTECDQYYAQQSIQLMKTDHFQFHEIKKQIMSISEFFDIKSKLVWLVTLADGQCCLWQQNDVTDNNGSIQVLPIEGIPCSVTTDPVTKQVKIMRADSVILVHNSDVQIAEFPNGTKFISSRKAVKIECPGYATITFDMGANMCVIGYEDGYQINCDSCGNYTIRDVNSTLNLSLSSQGKALYSSISGGKYQFDFSGSEIMFDAVDSSNYTIKMNLHGELEMPTDHCPISDFHEAFKPRVFIFNCDGTAYEAMKPAKIKESVQHTKFGVRNDFSIPNSQYMSVLLVHPGAINGIGGDGDGDLNELNANKKEALRNCNVCNFHQFILLEPLSIQKRDMILKSCQQSVSSGSQTLSSKQPWQNFIKAASDFLSNNSTKEVSSAKKSPHYPNSLSRALCVQRYDELQEILGAIQKSFVPVYFENDARISESHILTLNSEIRHLPPHLHKKHSRRAQETETPKRLISYGNPKQPTFDAPDIPEQEQLQENHFQQTQMQLQPENVDFGIVRKEVTYIRHVQLHNIGVHSSRFRIKPPPKSSGIKIHYSPGLVPAGLTTSLSVELCVSNNYCSDDAPSISYDLEIFFQWGHLSLPIKASIQII